MTRAFIGLGSNVGDREGFLQKALAAMPASGIEIKATSSFYDTDPVGVTDQRTFLNCACEVETQLTPQELVAALKGIEQALGRKPTSRWGPREIDLDLLLYADVTLDEEGLVVPHPEMTRRAFVLVPLLEIDPGLELPSGEPLSAFCEKSPSGVRLVSAG